MVAGSGGVEQAHIVVDPTGEASEGVVAGGELPRPSTYSIINLIPEHLCFTNCDSVCPTPYYQTNGSQINQSSSYPRRSSPSSLIALVEMRILLHRGCSIMLRLAS